LFLVGFPNMGYLWESLLIRFKLRVQGYYVVFGLVCL